MVFKPMTCAGCGPCRSMVCLSLSLSATRELKVDFSVEWTGEKREGDNRYRVVMETILPYRSKDIRFYLKKKKKKGTHCC